jgi:hypothetical protein
VRRFVALLCIALTGCGSAANLGQRVRNAEVLADLVSHAASAVSAFSDIARKDVPIVLDAAQRAQDCRVEVQTDPISAAGTCFALIQDFRAAGVPIPADVSKAADFLGAVAATAIEQGMRAISVPK